MKYKGKVIAAAVIICLLVVSWFLGSKPANRSGAAVIAETAAGQVSEAGMSEQAREAGYASISEAEAVVTAEETPVNQTSDENSSIPATPSESGPQENKTENPQESATSEVPELEGTAPETEKDEREISAAPGAEPDAAESQGMVIDSETGKDKYLTDPVPEGKPIPIEPQNVTIGDGAYTCTLSVRCDTILNNMELLNKEKHELVPADGVIFPPTVVTFYEGESVFNVLQREMKRAKIHMEFVNTPIYNSAYIEGINNLYEFDVGELSGWMYKVDDWFPNYGCSRYQLKQDEVVEWVYTCDLGTDVGGGYAIGETQ